MTTHDAAWPDGYSPADFVGMVQGMIAESEQLRRLAARATEPLAGEPLGGSASSVLAGDRLASSVVRPLTEALAVLGGSPSSSGGEPGVADRPERDTGPWEERLWQLAKAVTALGARPGVPSQVQEAAAGLQDLACSVTGDPHVVAFRLAELTDIQSALAGVIAAATDGPYLVTNVETVSDWLGEPIPVRPRMALCRCGASAIKPLCDGSHARVGFTSAKDPKRPSIGRTPTWASR